MKSIKPGRGPSLMGGMMSIAMAVFGLLWIGFTLMIGGGFFALFGVVFVIIAIVQAVYQFKNATIENRYSTFDIVDSWEESDPLQQRFGKKGVSQTKSEVLHKTGVFCPYCGAKAASDFVFCKCCGKKLV